MNVLDEKVGKWTGRTLKKKELKRLRKAAVRSIVFAPGLQTPRFTPEVVDYIEALEVKVFG